jgi:pyruvate/2-oxoglutarate dehydrogenase complex dihydrolipoamide dehydrogenase (E3) component
MLKNVAIPEHLLIIGGGYIGCEFASIYRTLGARVTLVEEKENLLPSWDAVAGDQIRHTLETQGVSIKLNEKIDPAPQETWTERPVLKLSDGTIASPGLSRQDASQTSKNWAWSRSGSPPIDSFP